MGVIYGWPQAKCEFRYVLQKGCCGIESVMLEVGCKLFFQTLSHIQRAEVPLTVLGFSFKAGARPLSKPDPHWVAHGH